MVSIHKLIYLIEHRIFMLTRKDSGVSPVIAVILLIALSVILISIISASVMSGISTLSAVDTKIVGFTVVVNDNNTSTVTPVSGKGLPYLTSYTVYLDNGHVQNVPDSGASVLSGAIITGFDSNVTRINIAGHFTDGITALVFSGKVINKTVVYDPSGGGQYFTMGTNGSAEFTSPADLESALNDWWHVLHPDSDIAYLQGNQLALYGDITIGKEPLTINQDLEMMYPNTNSGGLSQITFYRAPGYEGPLLVIESDADVNWNHGTLLTLEGNGHGNAPLMVIEDDASFNVATITLINNTNPNGNGGGIYNAGALTILSNSLVANNKAKYGGGIFIDTGGSLTMSGGSITGNFATENGGGVYNKGTHTLNSGSIDETNTAPIGSVYYAVAGSTNSQAIYKRFAPGQQTTTPTADQAVNLYLPYWG